MAIKQPTPPTPPTPPASPKGDTAPPADAGANSNNTGSEAGARDFGVHITISSPEDKGKNQQSNEGTAAKASPQQGEAGSDSKGEENSVTSQQSVQLPQDNSDQQLNAEVQDQGQKIHIGNNDSLFGQISIWPFVLIFVMALVGFTYLNRQKKTDTKRSTVSPQVTKESTQEAESKKTIRKSTKNDDDDDNIHGNFEVRI